MSRLRRAVDERINSALSKRVFNVEGVVIGYNPVLQTVDVEFPNPHGVSFGGSEKRTASGLSLPDTGGMLGLSPEPYKTGASIEFIGGNVDFPRIVKLYSLTNDIRYEKAYTRNGSKRRLMSVELVISGES